VSRCEVGLQAWDPCANTAAYQVTPRDHGMRSIDVCHEHVHDVAGDSPIEVIDLATGMPWEVES